MKTLWLNTNWLKANTHFWGLSPHSSKSISLCEKNWKHTLTVETAQRGSGQSPGSLNQVRYPGQISVTENGLNSSCLCTGNPWNRSRSPELLAEDTVARHWPGLRPARARSSCCVWSGCRAGLPAGTSCTEPPAHPASSSVHSGSPTIPKTRRSEFLSQANPRRRQHCGRAVCELLLVVPAFQILTRAHPAVASDSAPC